MGWTVAEYSLYLREITFRSNATSAPRGNFIIPDSVVAEFLVSQLADFSFQDISSNKGSIPIYV